MNYKLKLLVFISIVSISTYSQNYNPLTYFFNGTPSHGIKIKTNIPFQHGLTMPTIMLEGYEYEGSNVIDIKLNWYVYNNQFIKANASTSGSYNPVIKLSNENGKVSIFIDDKRYYNRFNIRAFSWGKGENSNMFEGWKAIDEPLGGTQIKEVIYKKLISGNTKLLGNVGLGSNPSTNAAKLEVRSDNNLKVWVNKDDQSAITFVPNNGNSIFHISHGLQNDLNFSHGSNVGANNLLTIKNNGSVGIGTTTPDAKLTVKGNIHTQEVKVDLGGAVAPDYVFEEEYKLKSLKEVEDYIKKEGHLPNIPSAAEMEKEGINLKEMNLKLLEKIEELTLYIIHQENRMENLSKEIKKLRTK